MFILPSSFKQTRKGEPFIPSKWGTYIQGIFEQFSGHKIGPSLLRSIFCTYNEGKEDVSEHVKESLASCMKHTRKTVSDATGLHTYVHTCMHTTDTSFYSK